MIPENIDAPQARAQATGTLWAAAVKPDGGRWGLGIAWRPERCFTVAGFGPCNGEDPAEPAPMDRTIPQVYPVGYRVSDECTTLGGQLDTSRVQRQADAVLSYELARELWTGALSTADPVTVDGSPYINPHLASADAVVVASDGTTVARRLGALEQAAMAQAFGQQVVLHVPARYVLEIGGFLVFRGDSIYTPLGSVVVADAGYPGTGPAGTGDSWSYATGPVAAFRSEVELVTDMASTLDRTTNRQMVWGTRYIAAAFDPCSHMAIDLEGSA
jgi:hypothetical protein